MTTVVVVVLPLKQKTNTKTTVTSLPRKVRATQSSAFFLDDVCRKKRKENRALWRLLIHLQRGRKRVSARKRRTRHVARPEESWKKKKKKGKGFVFDLSHKSVSQHAQRAANPEINSHL